MTSYGGQSTNTMVFLLLPFSEEYVVPITADKDVVDHFPRSLSLCDRSHVCTNDAAACSYKCT